MWFFQKKGYYTNFYYEKKKCHYKCALRLTMCSW